jgi:hypothetical protein
MSKRRAGSCSTIVFRRTAREVCSCSKARCVLQIAALSNRAAEQLPRAALFKKLFAGHSMCRERSTLIRATSIAAAAAIALGLLWTANGGPSAATADEVAELHLTPATPNHPVSLHDRLVVGLKARLPSELAFIDLVVEKVAAGELPERLVNETFFWARTHAGQSKIGRPQRPIIYFQPALVLRAKKVGIVL